MKPTALARQCRQIGWPLRVVPAIPAGKGKWLSKNGEAFRPELLIKEAITHHGADCSWCEGRSIIILIKAAALDLITKYNLIQDRSDAICRRLASLLIFNEQLRFELAQAVRDAPSEDVVKNAEEICSNPDFCQLYPHIRFRFLEVLSRVLTPIRLAEIADVIVRRPYECDIGWPDLTVIDRDRLLLIEVKTTDLFHKSQLNFANEVAKPLQLSCSVVCLKRIP
jgi:hypothetical protein